MLAGNISALPSNSTPLLPWFTYGSHRYNGMAARDWRIFLADLAIANIYWTLDGCVADEVDVEMSADQVKAMSQEAQAGTILTGGAALFPFLANRSSKV